MKKLFVLLFVISFIALPFLTLAVNKDAVDGLNMTAEGNFSNADVAVFVGSVIKGILALLGVIVLVFMVYGGYLWMASGGNEQMVKKSKDILFNTIIGLIIVIAAFAITNFVVNGIHNAASSSGAITNFNGCIINGGFAQAGTSCTTSSGSTGACDRSGFCQ